MWYNSRISSFCIIICCIVFHNAETFAQQRNAQGLKMVSKVHVKWYELDDKLMKDYFVWDVSYQYDDKKELVGVIKEYSDYGKRYKEIYEKNGMNVNGKVYENGKLLPEHTIYIDTRLNGYRVERYPQPKTEAEEIQTYYLELCRYHSRRDGMIRTERHKYIGTPYDADLERSDFERNVIGFDGHNTGSMIMFKDVFPYHYEVLMTKDSICFASYSFDDGSDTRRGIFINGDFQNCWDQMTYPDDVYYENVYSDRLNDTNIEYYCFAKMQYISEAYSNIEWSTDWLHTRSKHLMLYDGRQYAWGKSREESMKAKDPARYEKAYRNLTQYKMKFDYEFDERDNIKRIKIAQVDGVKRNCVIDIEYVY